MPRYTPTRLELLRAVAAGDVIEGLTEETEGHTWLLPRDHTETLRKVCARIREAEAAGWVWLEEAFWRLTDQGQITLEDWTS